MRPPRAALLAATLLCIRPPPCAADPAGYDILTLRLAMPAFEVIQRLAAQGITGSAIQLLPADCTAARADTCAQTLRAHTRDGRLVIRFTRAPNGPERALVYRIAYTITGRGPADAETLRADAIDRYGRPTSVATTTWCPTLDIATGLCPPGQPRLHIEPAPGAAGCLTLTDEALVTPASPPAP